MSSSPSGQPALPTTAGIILGGAHVWREDAAQALEPRLLLPVANVPLVCYTLEWLQSAGVVDVVMCVNAGVRLLRRRLGDGGAWGLRLHYYVDRMPRGPAGCLRDASELVEADEYVVVEGAILPTVDLRALLAAHRRSAASATLAVDGADERGAGAARESSPVGVHLFGRAAVAEVSPNSYQDIKEALVPRLLRAGQVVEAFPVDAPSPRISSLATYLAVQPWALERAGLDGDLHAEYEWHGTTAVHPTVQRAAGARIIGPAIVGSGTRIEDRALLIGPVVVGCDCRLGEGVSVTNSVIWDRAALGREARVDGCVVAAGAMVREGAVLRGAIWRATRARRKLVVDL